MESAIPTAAREPLKRQSPLAGHADLNAFDDLQIDTKSYPYRDLLGLDRWDTFTVSTTLAVVGTATYAGRYRIDGKVCRFQATAAGSTSLASTAGTSYLALPIPAKGIAGEASMQNLSTNVAVGACVIAVSTSRCYLPAQAASAATFAVCGSYEIG